MSNENRTFNICEIESMHLTSLIYKIERAETKPQNITTWLKLSLFGREMGEVMIEVSAITIELKHFGRQ